MCVSLLAHSSGNPRNFPSEENDKGVSCYANEVGNHLRMRAGFEENQPCNSRGETSSLTPFHTHTSEKGRKARD